MCDGEHKISNEKIFIPLFLQHEIVKKIYSNPNDRSVFNEIFKLCFRGHTCPRHRIDLTVGTGRTKDVIKCSYNKITRRCEISFNNKLKCSLDPRTYFLMYLHQLIHAYLYLSSSCSHDIYEARDHGHKFNDHLNRFRCRFNNLDWFSIWVYRNFKCVSGENSSIDYSEIRPIKEHYIVSSSNEAANVPNKTAPTNVQSTNRKIVTNNPKTPSTSQKKPSVPTNKKNTVNVPQKTVPRNVQSTNKNIATKKPLQVNANTVSTIVTKSSVPTNENNTAGSSRTSAIFPITTTLTNNQGDKIVSIAATKQSTVIVIHHD